MLHGQKCCFFRNPPLLRRARPLRRRLIQKQIGLTRSQRSQRSYPLLFPLAFPPAAGDDRDGTSELR
jgi:hypothetical protein